MTNYDWFLEILADEGNMMPTDEITMNYLTLKELYDALERGLVVRVMLPDSGTDNILLVG